MNDEVVKFPDTYKNIASDTARLGFDQSSDGKVGPLLETLCRSKVNGRFLELDTGTGLCTSRILKGMDPQSRLLSVENDKEILAIAQKHLGSDVRVEFICENGEGVISGLEPGSFDLIFADTWPGKYNYLAETLALLKIGGFYVIDDMLPQQNWPDGHEDKAAQLLETLEIDCSLSLVKMGWSSGVVIAVKTS